MSTIYGSVTIAHVASKGNALAAQDMIATSAALRAAAGQMQNGHIGAAQSQVVTPQARALEIAAANTTAIKSDGSGLLWNTATGVWDPAP
jgi:hypothetical protein